MSPLHIIEAISETKIQWRRSCSNEDTSHRRGRVEVGSSFACVSPPPPPFLPPLLLLLLLLFLLLCPMGTNLPKGSLLARTMQYIAICSGRYKAICLSVSRNRTRTLEPLSTREESGRELILTVISRVHMASAADTTSRYLAKRRSASHSRSLLSRNR